MNRRVVIAAVLGFLVTSGAAVVAAPADFPYREPSTNHVLYLEAHGGMAFPLGYFTRDFDYYPLMGYGTTFDAGLGVTLRGWMIGIQVSRDMWSKPADPDLLIARFNNNMLLLSIRRTISKHGWHFLPRWLEVIPGIAGGVNFINADIYNSVRAKQDGILSKTEFLSAQSYAVAVRASLDLALWFGTDFLVPYVGADYTVFADTFAGLSVVATPRVYAGIRLYPFGIPAYARNKRAERWKAQNGTGQAEAYLTVEPAQNFVPAPKKPLEIKPTYRYLEYRPQEWSVQVLAPDGTAVASWGASGAVPQSIQWDGQTESGTLLSLQDYTVRLLIVPEERDIERNGQEAVGTQTTVRTGMIVHEDADGAWHVYIESFAGDDELSPKQEQANAQIAEQLCRTARQRSVQSVTVVSQDASLAQKLADAMAQQGVSAAAQQGDAHAAVEVIFSR